MPDAVLDPAPAPTPASPAALATIQQTWAEVLGRNDVSPDDDFFELGGSSLVVAEAVAALGARLGLDLPPRALFEAPTPAELAELIAELRTGTGRGSDAQSAGEPPAIPDWAVPLQAEGERWPVFLFPAGHDEPRALTKDAQMAAQTGRAHPFWGLRREHFLLEATKQEGVASLAGEYAAFMRRIQPDGPYLLMGNCAGGYLAWETARLLLAAGEEIAGILFYQVPLRPDFDTLMPGFTPATITREWWLTLYYRPLPLPVPLTHLMTALWQAHNANAAWQRVTLGRYAPVIIPGPDAADRGFTPQRENIMAWYVRAWLDGVTGMGEG